MQKMKKLNILLITDKKPGHEQQSLGLVKALSNILSISVMIVPPLSKREMFAKLFTKRRNNFQMIIGAGHKTHASVLFLAWYYRAIKIILMKPSLPYSFFDACIVPNHDLPPNKPNIFSSQGALNQLVGPFKKAPQTLILLGGISKHYQWNNALIIQQLEEIYQKINQQEPILLTTSRRTPSNFLSLLEQTTFAENIQIFDHQLTPKNWLVDMLKISKNVYVTPDSISMIYEALTAECNVYLFNLPANTNKITFSIEQLKQEQWIFDYQHTNSSKNLHHTPPNEAQRCAQWIIKKFSLDIYNKIS